jgi:hypothetical protein
MGKRASVAKIRCCCISRVRMASALSCPTAIGGLLVVSKELLNRQIVLLKGQGNDGAK